MMQHVQQHQNVRSISVSLRGMSIVDDHISDLFCAVLLVQEVLGKSRCGDLRQTFVLGDYKHLILAQAAQAYAVF
jgi:hypothetical protein